jgi:hypothetical protein
MANPAAPPGVAAGPGFDEWSDGATLRLDYHHIGLGDDESCALDLLRREGAWPGSRSHLVDPLNLGPYRFEVRDAATQRILYAQGFSSIFSEWVTTEEAKRTRRSFHDAALVP